MHLTEGEEATSQQPEVIFRRLDQETTRRSSSFLRLSGTEFDHWATLTESGMIVTSRVELVCLKRNKAASAASAAMMKVDVRFRFMALKLLTVNVWQCSGSKVRHSFRWRPGTRFPPRSSRWFHPILCRWLTHSYSLTNWQKESEQKAKLMKVLHVMTFVLQRE